MEIPRTRDVYVLAKGDRFTVTVDQAMATGGWKGGQAVRYTASSDPNVLLVTYSDGYYCGFLLWGSDEVPDRFTANSANQPYYRFATVCAGGWVIATVSYEVYTWQSRQSGPLVPIVYKPSDRLVYSNRGLLTSQDEWTLSGDPRGANNYYVGSVAQAPVNGYLSAQLGI